MCDCIDDGAKKASQTMTAVTAVNTAQAIKTADLPPFKTEKPTIPMRMAIISPPFAPSPGCPISKATMPTAKIRCDGLNAKIEPNSNAESSFPTP